MSAHCKCYVWLFPYLDNNKTLWEQMPMEKMLPKFFYITIRQKHLKGDCLCIFQEN